MTFTAAAESTTVQLLGSAAFNYIGVDNVSLDLVAAPVPEPETWGLMLRGLAAVGAALKRRGRNQKVDN